MQFLYVGRLDKEKGIETLIFCINQLIAHNLEFHIDIYGKGIYASHIQNISYIYPKHITYHGRKNKKEIIGKRIKADYFIMPSIFLETFGLTACESLLLGVPVIGNKKGGLIPFIDNSLDIQQSIGANDGEKLYSLISELVRNNTTKENYKKLIKETRETYTTEQWTTSLYQIIPRYGHIMMVSDFTNYNGGGIETHIHDASHLLQENNYNISIYGHQAPTGKLAILQKLFIMCMSLLNIWDYYVIWANIKKKKTGLIWRHSISRNIGRLPLRGTNTTIPQIITHHELGLFHPFPSRATQEHEIPSARSLSAFLKAGQTNNIFKKIAIIGKYFMIRCIHKQLQKKIKTHIVPSERMTPMVRQRHPHAHIVCIPHFVSI